MPKDRSIEAQSLITLLFIGFVVAFINILFGFKSTVIDYFIFFIAWRVMVIENMIYKEGE